MLKKACWFALLAVFVVAYARPGASHWRLTENPPVVPRVSGEGETSPELRRQSFEIVWKTVKEKHFDPQLGGVDWDAVREKYLPRIGGVKTDVEFYDLLQQMLGELHESHFAIYPPEAVPDDDAREARLGTVGADVRIIDGLAVITRIQPGSPAARAGLATGFVIEAIDGTATAQISERASKGGATEGIKVIRQVRSVLARLNGDPGTSVEVAYTSKPGTRSVAKITRERLTGEMSARMGNFPPQHVEFDSRTVQDGIGYIRFNIFVMSIMDRLRSAI